MILSPATVLSRFLSDEAIVSACQTRIDAELVPLSFTMKVNHSPDTPDNLLTFYDGNGGRVDRSMSGKSTEHPSIQIICRSLKHSDAWNEIQNVSTILDGIYRDSLTIDGITYVIQVATRLGSIASLGVGDKNRRTLFSLNLQVCFESP